MNHLYWLSQIQASEQSLVGEQIFILSQLWQRDYPIIPGFVVSNTLFKKFLANIDDSRFLVSNFVDSSLHLDIDNYQMLQSVAITSRQAIKATELEQQWQEEILTAAKLLKSEKLILRPFFFPDYYPDHNSNSLWNHQTCICTAPSLSSAIKKIWAELFTAKSLFYWSKSNIRLEKINCNILVKPLKNASVSGFLEVSPTTFLIKSSWGLADSLERGEVEPDTYLIQRSTSNILEQKLGKKTLGYRVQKTRDSELELDCLESYLLTQLQSETYSLTTDYLKQLANLTEELIQNKPQISYLEWSLLDTEGDLDSNPQFYWTRLNYVSPVFYAQKDSLLSSTTTSDKPLLRGLGVSPGNTIGNVVVFKDLSIDQSLLPDKLILVTKAIAPSQIKLYPKISGIVAETGGINSHAAIIARELGIPAIVNANNATAILQTGDWVMLDGDRGEIHYAEISNQEIPEQLSINSPSLTIASPLATRIMVNLSNSDSITQVQQLPIDGVGLIRGELMLLELLSSQSLDRWVKQSGKRALLEHITDEIRHFVVAFSPRPVFYRSVDWNNQEFNHSEELELNPIVGDRGTYHYSLDSTLFDLELEAISIIQQEGYTNINLILPFVRSVEEFKFCRRRVEDFGLHHTSAFQLWIMAEVPSVSFLLPQYIEAGVQGILIGANDLTQLLLGVNREHSDFSRLGLNLNHPAVLDWIFNLSQVAKQHNLPCAIAINNPVIYPNLLDKLIQWNISIISVEKTSFIATYQEIARSEKRLLLDNMKNSPQ